MRPCQSVTCYGWAALNKSQSSMNIVGQEGHAMTYLCQQRSLRNIFHVLLLYDVYIYI